MSLKPKFLDSCYRWVDHVPVIETSSLSPEDLRAHLKAISRWVAEVVTFGFDTAGVPPARLNLSVTEAFALVKQEVCALTSAETYVFDFDEVPDEQWHKKGIWAYMKPRLGRMGDFWSWANNRRLIADCEEDGYGAAAGRAWHIAFDDRKSKIKAQDSEPHRYIHEISKNYWNMISITTKKRTPPKGRLFSFFPSSFPEPGDSERIAAEFYENARDAMPFVPEAWRLVVLTHEIGHRRLHATYGRGMVSRVDAEIRAESYGNLLSLWLGHDRRGLFKELDSGVLWQTAPKARGSQHLYAQTTAEIACGAPISSAQSVYDNLTPLRKAMGWEDLPADTVVGSDDIFRASEKLATAVAEDSLPNSYAERQAALCLAQLWQLRPDMIERGSETLKAACVWGDGHWTALSRRGEARMRAVLDDAQILTRLKISPPAATSLHPAAARVA